MYLRVTTRGVAFVSTVDAITTGGFTTFPVHTFHLNPKTPSKVMQLSNVAGPETDREMYSIAKEEHTECVSALERLRLDLTGLLLPR